MTQTLTTSEQAYNATRAGQHRYTLIWIKARNRDTGAVEAAGFWTGPYDQAFVVDGETRSYIGAGAALDIDDIPGGTGLDIRYITARLAIVDEVEDVIRGYDPRLAPAEIHTVAFDLSTGNLISAPRRIFKGAVNETPITVPVEGGDAFLEVTLASSARELTRTLPLYRSDGEMRRRSGTDRFREHVSTTGIRQVAWGEAQVRSNEVADAPAAKPASKAGVLGDPSWGP